MYSIVSQYFMEFSSLDRLLLWWVPILLSYDCLLPIALTFMLNDQRRYIQFGNYYFFPIFILSYPFLDFINNCYLEKDQNLFQIWFVFLLILRCRILKVTENSAMGFSQTVISLYVHVEDITLLPCQHL